MSHFSTLFSFLEPRAISRTRAKVSPCPTFLCYARLYVTSLKKVQCVFRLSTSLEVTAIDTQYLTGCRDSSRMSIRSVSEACACSTPAPASLSYAYLSILTPRVNRLSSKMSAIYGTTLSLDYECH